MKVIDIHHHFGYHGSGNLPDIAEDSATRIKMMEKCGISSAVIMPSPDYYMPDGIRDTQKVNEMMAAYRKGHSGRFPLALGTVEPRHGERSREELHRIIKELRLDGVMWHHRFQGAHINHEMTRLCLTEISNLNAPVPVFIHNYSGSNLEAPWRLEVLARAFPDITFVSLSSLSSPENINMMLQVAQRQKNIFLETGMLFPQLNVIERVVREIGSHRLLFGSDTYTEHPATDPQLTLEMIMKANISEEDKMNILERNVGNIFHRATSS